MNNPRIPFPLHEPTLQRFWQGSAVDDVPYSKYWKRRRLLPQHFVPLFPGPVLLLLKILRITETFKNSEGEQVTAPRKHIYGRGCVRRQSILL
ncbi:unnamed protein product [Symbiodinium natans]|uniref:Uncharacterized protein n=1 Tax=Symbiodinium natans TaxID=878477 RepID=A0A812STG2_9DINO|nr:unnamed protein product [Symbiodinium natans]